MLELQSHLLTLFRRRPHVLQQSISLCQSVERVIALAHGTDEAAEGVGDVVAGVAAGLVDLTDRDLYRGVVLGLDDAVGSAAFARDVAETKSQLDELFVL
jgi:hypothetical protein